MMVPLKYGKQVYPAELGNAERIITHPSEEISREQQSEMIKRAIRQADVPLQEHISCGDSVAVVVSDHTRPTGSGMYIPLLLKALEESGAGKITIIIALGLHRPSTADEIESICGGAVPEGVRVINHDAAANLVKAGDAFFNREAMEADALVLTGAVTFHPMAGYSGGRKSLLPGIASAEDIYANHRLYFEGLRTHSGVGPAELRDNPVQADIQRRTAGCGKPWALNVVMDEQGGIEFAAAGPVDSVWEKCCGYVGTMHTAQLDTLYDTVVSSAGGSPSDFSFYQSMKVLTNSSRACREGGRLIVLSECTHGWEIRDGLFEYFNLGQEQIAAELKENFSMDGLALYMALRVIRSREVWLYSSLSRKEVEAAGMHYLGSPGQIGELAAGNETEPGKSRRIAVMENGSSVLPILKKQERGTIWI